ncbi:phosphoribosyl-AMP cyclohydrolase [Amylibacter sp.]|nr:phosphoribosyl-AMP cyclohydrolase [Amylibacter sp.]MDB2600832.1 phosphoribosyl-AMP cyclohydrolase [Amylibacter sp.]
MVKFDISSLKYDDKGLIPAVVQDSSSLEVLMVAWMNKISLEKTINTNLATFWSRSRNSLWVKGLTSGNTQKVDEVRFDCDRDCILLLVTPKGPACHTNRRTCFYTELVSDTEKIILNPEV